MNRQLTRLWEARAKLRKEAPPIDREIDELVRARGRQLVDYGAPALLDLELQPFDHKNLLEQAKPVTPDDRIKADPAPL
jgi:hypothetical protein